MEKPKMFLIINFIFLLVLISFSFEVIKMKWITKSDIIIPVFGDIK